MKEYLSLMSFLVFIYSVFDSGDIVKKLLKVGDLEKKDKNGDRGCLWRAGSNLMPILHLFWHP